MFIPLSCSLDVTGIADNANTSEEQVTDGKSLLNFSSSEELSEMLEYLASSDTYILPKTKSVPDDFISLRQSLLEEGLRSFSDDELRVLINEDVEYEPEDSLITDPYLCALLNSDREISVGGCTYKFTECGVISGPKQAVEFVSENDLLVAGVENLEHGDIITLGNETSFTAIKYQPAQLYVDDDLNQSETGTVYCNSDNSNPSSTQTTTIQTNDACNTELHPSISCQNKILKIDDNVVIRDDDLRIVNYASGDNDASPFSQWLSDEMNDINIVAINEFDSAHRLKHSLFAQDYIIVRRVGTKVRMQKKVLGTWWRSKAEEFRIGWTSIECKYCYDNLIFSMTPPNINGVPAKQNTPIAMIHKFPFADDDIVLFHIDRAHVNITTGDINTVFASGIKYLENTISAWLQKEDNHQYENSPKGLYYLSDDDRSVVVIYPKSSEADYEKGKDKIIMDRTWFSGNFVLSFGMTFPSGSFGYKSSNISQAASIEFLRGCSFAAVKYNGQWKGCVIQTK